MKSCEEWLLAFNQYYNNITSNKAPGLEPYEISRFLTDAQTSVVVGLYNGTLGAPFESTEQVTAYLAPLVFQDECVELASTALFKVNKGAKVYEIPEDALFVTLEICYVHDDKCGDADNEREVVVVPVTQDEYWRTSRDPFKMQNRRRVLRLAHGEAIPGEENTMMFRYAELISKDDISRYIVRYIKKPEPIIIEDLSGFGLSIDGYQEPMTCVLPEVLHPIILAEAVRMAKAVWQS